VVRTSAGRFLTLTGETIDVPAGNTIPPECCFPSAIKAALALVARLVDL
jgi:hypothetical protein